jgi:drug/metabolite transporter (DMT)-like permease
MNEENELHVPSDLDDQTTRQRKGHVLGVLYLIASALIFSTAGLFTKGVEADAWSVIFWRGLSAAIFALGYVILRGALSDELRRFNHIALLAAVLMASGTAAFIPSFKLTSIANVSLIWASAPAVAACLSWALLKERPSRRIVIASALAFAGVFIVVKESFGSGNIVGDLLAFWMTLMMASTMVLYRKYSNTPTVLPAALSSIFLLPAAWYFTSPSSVSTPEIWTLIGFGLVFAVASVLLSEGARRVPAAEAALISALETPLAPIWAFLLLSQVPSTMTIFGGVIIFTAVVWSQRIQQA